MRYKILALLCVFLANACATSKDSTLLGIGIGSAIGAGFGAAVGSPKGNERKGAITGTIVGAAIGGLIAFLDHREQTNKKLEHASSGYKTRLNDPFVTKPKVRRVWMPEKITGNKYEAGHWMFIIQTPSTWRKGERPK